MSFETTRQGVEFDPETGDYRTTYDYPSRPPSVAVPLALMEMTGDDVTTFDPMYEAEDVDPDALDELFRPTSGGVGRESQVTFSYQDFEITVESLGNIVISPEGDDGLDAESGETTVTDDD